MAYRQRNIPVTSKEESECQTDVKLLQNYFMDIKNQEDQRRMHESNIKVSEIYGSSGLLRPFADHHILKDFSLGIQDMKNMPYDEKVFAKRLEVLESHINGLLKRDFLIYGSSQGSQTWTSYYSTLNQKEKDVIRLEREKIYSNIRTAHLEEKIKSLEQQVEQLRIALVHATQAVEQNKLYSDMYKKINQIITTGQKKGTDIEKILEEQMMPVFSEFNLNLTAITRIINKETHISIRPIVQSMAKEFDRLLKEQAFNQDKLNDTLTSLINNFKALKGVDYLRNQFELAQRAEMAESNYKNMLSLFNHELESLKADHPYLKGVQKLDWLLRRLEDQRIELVSMNGWMNLAVTEVRVHEVAGQDKKLRELLGVLAGQFKSVYAKFPELKKHCSVSVMSIFESELLLELIEGGSIERLKSIIVHEVETVRVDDVYRYQDSKQAKMILHLRVLIKSLLEELYRVKDKYGLDLALDEAILAMLKEQCIDGINIEAIVALFRPPARYIEVPIVIENKVHESHTYEKGVPINTSDAIVVTEEKLQVVSINKEVPVIIERPVECVLTQQVPVQIRTEKMVEASTNRDVIVDRVVETCKEVPSIRQTSVPAYIDREVVKEVEVDRIVKEAVPHETEKIVEIMKESIIEVDRNIEKLVVTNEIREVIKEVEVRVPQIITKTEVLQVQKVINHTIQKEIPVEVVSEIPVQIRVPEIQYVDVVEYRDKPIYITNTKEELVEVELKVQKQIVKEVPKEIFIDRSHFIKGDIEQKIRQVQVYVDKPIIQEILVTRDVEIEKAVPLYIHQEVAVVAEVEVPCVKETVKEIEVQNVKVVTAKQQVVKPVNIDKPVPIIVEKEIVKVEPQFIDRIVEKIVEVPRVVEVEKIVEKIVVVPRIVEKIIEVPKIIEKIVVEHQTQLQIVQIPVPQVIIQNVELPIEVPVEKTIVVRQKDIEFRDVEKIIELKTVEQKMVEIEVEKRVPYPVINEIPVETYRDRIEYQKVEIHQTKVEPIEVQIPVVVQEKVPFYIEKEVVKHEIIQQPVVEKLYVEKDKIVVQKEEVLVVKDKIIEKPIIQERLVEVPGPEKVIQVIVPETVQVIEERIVKELHYEEKIREVPCEVQKIVQIIHEKIVPVTVNELVTTPELIEVPKIVNLTHYKEIPVDTPVRQERIETTIVQDIKPVEKIVEKPIQVEASGQTIKEIVKEVLCTVREETEKEINKEVQILVPTETKIVEVQGPTVISKQTTEIKTVDVQSKLYQKLVEKIVLMPQIVEIVKNVHHIAQVNQLGVAVDADINVQAEKFVGVSSELKKALVELLGVFRSNERRQPDLKNLIVVIEKYLKYIEDWITFPKLVEIEKIVEREVEKEKPIIIPTSNKDKQSALFYIMEKLLTELRRVKEAYNITLSLDEQISRIFFSERRGGDDNLDRRFNQMQEILREKYRHFGQLGQSHPFVIGSFLQDTLSKRAFLDEANEVSKIHHEELINLRKEMQSVSTEKNHLLIANRQMYDENSQLMTILEKYHNYIDTEEFENIIRQHRTFRSEILEGRIPLTFSAIQRSSRMIDSVSREVRFEESQVVGDREGQFGQLMGKLNKSEMENQTILMKSRRLQTQITKYTEELNVKNSIIKRLETDFESKLSRARDELAKSPNVNKDIIEQNKKLLERTRTLERECSTEKMNAEKARKELQRSAESQKRDITRELDRKDKEYRDLSEKSKRQFDRQLKRITTQFEKVKRAKEKLDEDIAEIRRKHSEEIKNIREQQLSGATTKNNELIGENMTLRKKIDRMEAEYQKLEKAAVDNNTTNERQTQKLKSEIEKLQTEKRNLERRSHQKQGFLDLTGETQLINVKIQLQKKIKSMELDLQRFRNKDDSAGVELKALRDKVKNLEIELDVAKRQLETSHKMKSTTFQSGYKSGVATSEYVVESSVTRSPRGPYYRSAQEKGGMVSPQSIQSEERIEEMGSSSSRFSHESEERPEKTLYRPQMTLREFMDVKHDDKDRDVCMTYVMIKIIQAVEKDAENGAFNSYSPSNIYLQNFNVKHLDKLTVKFGSQIFNKDNRNDGLYLAPQILEGSISTKKSVVFCLGVILDELIHGSTFFRSMQQISDPQNEFRVRGEKLNPILKNTLFEMMSKESSKRLELIEAKRRLSLQKYITAEGRGGRK